MSPTGREREHDAKIILRMPQALRSKLEKLAEKDRRNLSDYVRIVLEDHASKRSK